MAKRLGTHFVISASLTDTGAPVYLRADGGWSGDLQQALPIEGEAERDALLEQALRQERTVCDPYFFDVGLSGSGIDPLSVREKIRAQGPSTRIRRPD
jgi:hypothetical protein